VASAFAFERENPDVVYAGITGLFRTDDFGDSWQRLFPTTADVTAAIMPTFSSS